MQIFDSERRASKNKNWHKKCFYCVKCHAVLDASHYAFDGSGNKNTSKKLPFYPLFQLIFFQMVKSTVKFASKRPFQVVKCHSFILTLL